MEKMFQILETAWPAVKTTGLTGCVTAPETEDNLLLLRINTQHIFQKTIGSYCLILAHVILSILKFIL